MAIINPKTLSVTDGENTYILRGLTSAEVLKIQNALDESSIGVSGGVAGLDENGKVPSSQLPISPGGSLPTGGNTGSLLAKRSSADGDAEWVLPADSPEEDNTRPITAAAVYTTVGNINALLATI